jgi:hypothetical protein
LTADPPPAIPEPGRKNKQQQKQKPDPRGSRRAAIHAPPHSADEHEHKNPNAGQLRHPVTKGRSTFE